MAKLSNINEFISKSKKVHGNKYNYSLVNYVNNNTMITIICPEHGNFEQLPRSHTSGSGCRQCKFDSYKKPIENFFIKAKKIHKNKYDYSLVKYINFNTKVTIVCPKHGNFEQTPNNHINKNLGCKICNKEITLSNKLKNFINKVKKIHRNKYDYSLVKYFNKEEKVDIICPKHNIFKQTPHNHLKGKGCPTCKESYGEKTIRNYLTDNNIVFVSQYKFLNCKYKKLLRFDFYLPEFNICIEYNGRQHYESVSYFGGDLGLEKTKKRDIIKKEYCKKNNINLIIIKYNEDILKKLKQISIVR